MEKLQQQRAPLFGRVDLRRDLRPFVSGGRPQSGRSCSAWALRRAAEALPARAEHMKLLLFAREQISVIDQDLLGFTAEDLYR